MRRVRTRSLVGDMILMELGDGLMVLWGVWRFDEGVVDCCGGEKELRLGIYQVFI